VPKSMTVELSFLHTGNHTGSDAELIVVVEEFLNPIHFLRNASVVAASCHDNSLRTAQNCATKLVTAAQSLS
jgi:hypothetical protein